MHVICACFYPAGDGMNIFNQHYVLRIRIHVVIDRLQIWRRAHHCEAVQLLRRSIFSFCKPVCVQVHSFQPIFLCIYRKGV